MSRKELMIGRLRHDYQEELNLGKKYICIRAKSRFRILQFFQPKYKMIKCMMY